MKTPNYGDSARYGHRFYGILNADGDFWTPLAFESESKARKHVENFWSVDKEKAEECLRDFKFVLVRVQLSLLYPDAPRPQEQNP